MIVEDGREAGPRRLQRLVWGIALIVLGGLAGLWLEYGDRLPDGKGLSDNIRKFVQDYLPDQTPQAALTPVAEASPPVSGDLPRDPKVTWASMEGVRMADYMPPRAVDEEVDGESTVACRWDANGRVTGCTILSERPAGYGFGQATLRLVYAHGRVESTDPADTLSAGEGLKMRFRWVME
ncbi:MAG: hypothetical protein QM667_05220 [Asticcacaulis sp.]